MTVCGPSLYRGSAYNYDFNHISYIRKYELVSKMTNDTEYLCIHAQSECAGLKQLVYNHGARFQTSPLCSYPPNVLMQAQVQ